jgi:hypothetical protein
VANFDADLLCGFLDKHIPEAVAFTYDSQRYVSCVFAAGIQFQITSDWCRSGSIPCGQLFYVPRSALVKGISDHLQTAATQGFGFMNRPVRASVVSTYWWHTDTTGDGVVWPNAFGDLVVRWQRPVHLDYMLRR